MAETDDEAEAESREQGTPAAVGDSIFRDHDNLRCQATSVMSRISGVRRNRTASTGSVGKLDSQPPTYGVEDVADSILAEVRDVVLLHVASGIQTISKRRTIGLTTLTNMCHFCLWSKF